MLTLDDLDHFSDASLAHLFAPATRQADADALARLTRIVACLNFCRDVADEELGEGGLHAARRALRSVLRCQQRKLRLSPAELMGAVKDSLQALGVEVERRDEASDVSSERHAVEGEIQTAADKLADEDTLDPQLMGALARGEFEILPSSDLLPLAATVGSLGGTVTIDLDVAVDQDEGPAIGVRLHMVVESGFWRWAGKDGCWISRNEAPPLALAADDPVVRAVLAGLGLRNGRAILAWAEAACAPGS